MQDYKKLITVLVLIMTGILSLNPFTVTVYAAETTIIVDLNKKIKNDFHEMSKVTRESDEKSKSLNREIESLVNRMDGTDDGAGRDALANQYFRLRVEQLHIDAGKLTDMGKLSSNIVQNMVNLQEEMRNYGKSINGGIRLTTGDAKEVGQTVKGLAQIIAPIAALKGGDPRVQNLSMTLRNLDSRYRSVFNSAGGSSSLDEQIRYMEDLNAYIESTKALLNEERVYLQSTIFALMADGIVKVINDISMNIYQNKGSMVSNYGAKHDLDARVLGRRASIRSFGNAVDLNPEEIGNYGGQK